MKCLYLLSISLLTCVMSLAHAVEGEGRKWNSTSSSNNIRSLNLEEFSGRGTLCEFDFEEVNGIAILEAESIDISGTQWERKAEFENFTGSSYIEWTGPNSFGRPGQGLIEAKIKINIPGKYRIRWRSRVGEGNNSTESNDSWLRLPDADGFFGERMRGGTITTVFPRGSGNTPVPMGSSSDNWFKVFLSGSTDWTFSTNTSDNDAHQIFGQFDTPGIYTIQISGRSKHHLIDRITLSRAGDALDIDLVETRCPDAPDVPGPPESEPVLDCTAAPSNFVIVGTTATTATFEFDNVPGNIRRFELRAFLEGEFTGALGPTAPRPESFSSVDNGATSITINGLTEGVSYEFALRAICMGQTPRGSQFATVISTVTAEDTPQTSSCENPPSNFRIGNITANGVTLEFDNNLGDTRVIEVKAFLAGTFTGDLSTGVIAMGQVTNGQNTVSITGLDEAETYDFVIRALCPGETPEQSNVGTIVTATTESIIPLNIGQNNFRIQVTGESCPTSEDGNLIIFVEDTSLNYTVKISSSALEETIIENFQNEFSLRGLSSGTYRVCFTVIEQVDFMQCFDVEIKEPENLQVAEELFPSSKQLNLTLTGGDVFEIQLNDKIFFTTENTFILDLDVGENTIKVTADRDCQGSFSKKITIPLNKFSLYPNPAIDKVNIVLPVVSEKITIAIFDISGKIIRSSILDGGSGNLSYPVDFLSSGIYFVSITGENVNENIKLIKE